MDFSSIKLASRTAFGGTAMAQKKAELSTSNSLTPIYQPLEDSVSQWRPQGGTTCAEGLGATHGKTVRL